jgi:hypothetical protein
MTELNENIEWKKRVLDSKSKSFCGAKWYNATIWLGNGATASCHHPPPHKIDPEEVKNNPSAIHNTHYKKLVRKQMLEGVKPKECEYCWKMEDLGPDYVSDRFYKSAIYTEEDLQTAFNTKWDQDVTLKTLEVAFDNNCNFACSYCNSGFSTTWAHDINVNGAYNNLESDGWGAYAHNGAWAQPYGVKNKDNPYTEAFWKWWESELQYTLLQLRVTGGEATTSHDFWKLIKWYEANTDCNVELAINTNLGVKRAPLERLCKLSRKIKKFALFTSNESVGLHAEYIRHGLNWNQWRENLEYAITNGRFTHVHIMLTINALCLKSIDKLHEIIFELREKYKDTYIDTSHNILRFPSFQSITTLPNHIRAERVEYLTNWLEQNNSKLYNYEVDGLKRTITYISEMSEGHSVRTYSDINTRQGDFYNFYNQYDKRRKISFIEAFSDWPEMLEWYDSLKDNTNSKINEELVSGDATMWGDSIFKEVLLQEKDNND